MKKLWLFGDSFGYVNPNDINSRIWSHSVSKKLKYELVNTCQVGTAQDWAIDLISKNKKNISSEDQIILILTDPARYWFFQDMPRLTNIHVIDFDEQCGLPRARAAEYYFRFIQRIDLDILLLEQRLGWLNNMVNIYGWRKPIILFAYEQIFNDINEFNNLNFSKGCLADISQKEYSKDLWKSAEGITKFTRGIDPRYNHLCLQNHEILSDKICATLLHDADLDLKIGFNKEIFTEKTMNDPNFKNEISGILLEKHKINKPTTHWLDKIKNL
jgi:hypothetical protein